MATSNTQVIFIQRPVGTPTPDIFELKTSPIPELAEGEFLVRNHFISMDPALVSRMRDEENYTENVIPGEVMHAYCVGEIVDSKCEEAPEGQMRMGRFDMQEYALCRSASEGTPISTEMAPASWWLGVVGATGATAYLSFHDICQPKTAETLVVSSAGSSVGSVVAQLANKEGCRTVGIVSTDEKAARVKEEFGYDAVISYRGKEIAQLASELAAACPGGVDMYYDNTSGDISEALLDLYNVNARIAVIGRMGISHLADTRDDIGRRDNNVILAKRIRKQGFVLLDHRERMMEALMALGGLIKSGDLQVKEDIVEGIANAPGAFFRMLAGDNNGKQLVKLV